MYNHIKAYTINGADVQIIQEGPVTFKVHVTKGAVATTATRRNLEMAEKTAEYYSRDSKAIVGLV